MRGTQKPSIQKNKGLKDSLYFFHPSSKHGRKRRFLISGIINTLITNLVLQALLISETASVGMATFISQICNGCVGYIVYGNLVFNSNSSKRIKTIIRYCSWLTVSWLINWLGIALLSSRGLMENLGGVIMIGPLACTSYIIQKNWIFTNDIA